MFDSKTGLYAMGERYYNPKAGRFTQLDPLGGGYPYALDNPVNYVDPSGLEDELPTSELSSYESFITGTTEPVDSNVEASEWAPSYNAGYTEEGCSFTSDTSVATNHGEVPIASLQPGDQVLAYNQSTGTTGSYTVQATWQHQDPTLESVTINGDTLTTTPEHPFDTKEKGWVPAGKLWKGAHVRNEQGAYGVVQKIAYSHHAAVMYNLTVSTAHTYYVGAGRWLVHNACGRSGRQQRLRSLGTDPKQSRRVRGWIRQEMNARNRSGGRRGKGIRNPRGYVLAHRRGKEARRGFSYSESDLQSADLHKLQHHYEGY